MAPGWVQLSVWSIAVVAAGQFAPSGFARADEHFVGPPAPASQVETPPASNAPLELRVDEPVARPAPAPAPALAPAIESTPLGSARADTSPLAARQEDAGASASGWVRTVGALLLIVGLIFSLKWGAQRIARRAGGIGWQLGAAGRAPSGVLEVLGRYPVARGQTLVLLKLDRRILLVSQSSAGFQTLTEVSDPEEVASLLIKTRDDEGASMAARFTAMLREMERDPSIAGDAQDIDAGEPATGARLPRIGLKGVTA